MFSMSSARVVTLDVSKMKDVLVYVCFRLHRSKKSLSLSEVDIIQRVDERIKFWKKCQSCINDYHNHCSDTEFKTRLVQTVRDYVLRHEWTWTLKVIRSLACDSNYALNKVADTLWKAGLMSLMIEKKEKLLDPYVRQLKSFPALPCVEVLLDYAQYLLVHGDIDRAEIISAELKATSRFDKTQKKSDCRLNARRLFSCYQGLLYYLKWKSKVDDKDSVGETVTDYITQMLQEGLGDKASKQIADKAMENFKPLMDSPGVWDICIVKMLEIHKYYGDQEAARELLHVYRKQNSNNPNAYRYLHRFESEYGDSTDDAGSSDGKFQSKNLISLLKLDPSNPLAIQLVTDRQFTDPKVISVIFDYLDFDHCKDDTVMWEMLDNWLSDLLDSKHSMVIRKKGTTIVRNCWLSRKDWWPLYHFQVENSCLKLKAHKSSVYNYLKDISN